MSLIRKASPFLPLVALLVLVRDAHGIGGGPGACKQGDTLDCTMPNGKPGFRICVNGVMQACKDPSSSTTPPPPPPTYLAGRYDLVRTPPFAEFDDNGVRLNPQWRGQTIAPNELPSLGNWNNYCGTNGATQPWEAPCTSQQTSTDSTSVGTDIEIWLGNVTGFNNGSCGSGHHNWMPVTYTGQIFWESHAPSDSDDDYNIRLIPPPVGADHFNVPLGAGATAQELIVYPPTSEVTSPNGAVGGGIKVWPTTHDPFPSNQGVPTLGIEFDSDETIDHFTTRWWKRFHSTVDDFGTDEGVSRDCFNGNPTACNAASALFNMISGKFAIVTGLMGMDTAHGIYPEIHPAFAMAIRVNDDPSDETWEIFVRRSGDEGFCSSNLHILDNLPNNTYTFRLPSRGAAVSVTQEEWGTELGSILRFFPNTIEPSQGKLVSFVIPPPRIVNNVLVSDMIHGEIHLKWSGGTTAPPRPGRVGGLGGLPGVINVGPGGGTTVAPAPAPPPPPEDALEALIEKMTPTQKQLFHSKLPPKPTPTRHDKAPKLANAAQPLAGAARAPQPIPLPLPVPVVTIPTTRMVPNPVKIAKDQKLVEALHAVYGPKLDQNLPPKPPPRQRCVRNPKTGETICAPVTP
jgi:hypothetical protein